MILDEARADIYRRASGIVNYIALGVFPELACSARWLCRFLAKPLVKHFRFLVRVVMWLGDKVSRRMYIKKDTIVGWKGDVLQLFTDANHSQEYEDFKSVAGSVVAYKGVPVYWHSKKMPAATYGVPSAELVGAFMGCLFAVYFNDVIRLLTGVELSITLLIDCSSVIDFLRSKVMARTKFKFLNEIQSIMFDLVDTGKVRIKKVASAENVADFMTKYVSAGVLENLMGFFDVTSTTRYVHGL